MRFESEITIFKLDSVADAVAEGSAIANQHLYWSDSEGVIISRDVVGSVSQFTGGNVRIGDRGVSIYLGQEKVAEYGQSVVIGNKANGEPYVGIDSDGLALYDRKNRVILQADVSQVLSSDTSYNYIDFNILETAVNGYSNTANFTAEYFLEVYDYYVQLIRTSGTTTLTDSDVTITASVSNGNAVFNFTLSDSVISDAVDDTNCTIRVATHFKAQVPTYTIGVRSGESKYGMYSYASGRGCTASGDYATAMGNSCSATAYGAFSVGMKNIADTAYSGAIGRNLNTSRAAQLACGMFNDDDEAADALFVVGNGTSDSNKSNAFYVDSNGNVYIAGNLVVVGTVTST